MSPESIVFRPMLASAADIDRLRYPLLASPKLDGIRASVVNGRLLTRTLKEVPNRHVFKLLSRPELEGLDGELIVGDPTGATVYRDTVSGVMSTDGKPDFRFFVFDNWCTGQPFAERLQQLESKVATALYHLPVLALAHLEIETRSKLDLYEADVVERGFEGVMLRDPSAPYKFGRATAREGYLLKVKRYEDSEAIVLDIEEEMFNGNEAKTNELGRTQRSSAKAGKVGKGTMGALVVRDLKTGVEFNIGTGFTAADRTRLDWKGKTVKYRFFPVGVKERPRHPSYLGLRDARDL